ncbi:hypothetical protein FC54_GL001256 [Ligilactobacillus saerimneri DSM 16049]|nr:hypothetical protein FC54_GL001256 [Ligilactobacillus saerimneri DSM 16049]
MFDVLCYVAALAVFVWGFFRINTTAGIFALGVALLILGLLSEMVAQKQGGGD